MASEQEDKLRSQRERSLVLLADYVVQERRAAKKLEELRSKIDTLHDDVMALDKALTLVT